jgi:hypothetical protein
VSKEKLFYIGKFGETIPTEDNEMIKEAEMFSTGVHRGVEYTEDDLNELVTNFDASEEIPVQLDHSESARDTVGYIQEASVKDGKLMGKVKIIDEYAKERIDKGLMKKLSVSFYLKYTEEGFKPHKIREVSLVAFPQVKSARLFSENGYVSDYEEQGGNKMGAENKTEKFSLEDIVAEVRKTVESEIHEQYSELQKKVEKLEGVEAKFTEAQVTSKIEKFQADNKIVPAQTDSLTKLLSSFSEEQVTLFEEFMTNSAKADFSEQGEVEQENGQDEDKDERTQEQKDFDAFYEEHTRKFGKSL